MLKVSPLAPMSMPEMPYIEGVIIATAVAEERYQGRDDLSVVICDQHTTAAGVFTQSTTAGAAVLWSRQVLKSGNGIAMVVNAGNANVCTGTQGVADARAMAVSVAEKSQSLDAEQVFVSSTGVIGETLKLIKLTDCIDKEIHLDNQQDWLALANAIKTTDTYPKLACAEIVVMGEKVKIAGVAKGSGMVEPNMATMLAYVYTDAKIGHADLQAALNVANQLSFGCITVDSDTSTSDTCLLFATGKAGNQYIEADSGAYAQFQQGLNAIMVDLAQQVAKDGEGASKFIEVTVTGAETDQSAKKVAKCIANSPLVKTAIAGEDANWGRIVMAVGKSYEPIVLDKLSVSMGGVAIAAGDGPVQGYDQSLVNTHLAGSNISIEVGLGTSAKGNATVWTCDLTHGYIEINADYRS